jgi:hypothetical protein
VWALTPAQARDSAISKDAARADGPVIRFSPSRQVLHGPSAMKILIEDQDIDFDHYEVAVRYNGLDVSKNFLQRAKVTSDKEHSRILIENPMIQLSSLEDHQIEVLYRNPLGHVAYARYDSPRCELFQPTPVRNVASFNPSHRLVQLIERISHEKNINPAFSTGLIAQESGFNPRAVSWAKAVGLTQVTPIAEQEILRLNPTWPVYPEFNERPVPSMKALVMSGRVNAKNEWRLEPEQSIRGGIDYTILLSRLWSTPENTAKIRTYFSDVEAERTRLILASYHSGYSRVLSALDANGAQWIFAPELSEARNYVNRILSYCSYFTEKEFSHENAT